MKILNIMVRKCVPLDTFTKAVVFYENLVNQKARLSFDYPEYQLKLAQVATILIIGGTEESLAPFIATDATFYVDSIKEYEVYLPSVGATIEKESQKVPTGYNMLVCHPDGMLVEYVEHTNKHELDFLPALAGK